MSEVQPNVYARIAAVSAEMAHQGISKSRSNAQQGYKFRGIDDVFNALAPMLSKHSLVIVPRILSRECTERQAKNGGILFSVVVEAEFDFCSALDGSKHTARTFGEAMDSGDKATNKAMSAAYKYAAFQAFCIPTEGDNDADASTPEPIAAAVSERAPERPQTARQPSPEPPQTPSGAVTVTGAKVAKKGTNSKGPWTLYAITLSDGREGTTFSSSVFNAASEARSKGLAVDVTIDGKNITRMEPVYQMEEAPF